MRALTVFPSTNSMAMKRPSGPSPTSYTWAIAGWFTAAAACASLVKRSLRSLSRENSGGSTLRATGRPRFVSRAL